MQRPFFLVFRSTSKNTFRQISESFSSALWMKSLEIHKVFLRISMLEL